jgi:hypothetical protein
MKTKSQLFIIAIVAGSWGSANAQQPTASSKEKMTPLSAWVGRWQGEGSMMTPSGETRKSSVDEKIEAKLDNTLIVMEGIGKMTDPSTSKETIVHHAFGILSFDPYTNQYKLKTYLKDGKSAEAWFNVLGENNYQWGFDNPMGKTRYTIALDPGKKSWYEFGEFSKDGTTWKKFFEMSLTKVD